MSEQLKTCPCGNQIVLAHGEDECAICYMHKGRMTDRQLIDELIRRTEHRLNEDPRWNRFLELRDILYDAGKIVAEWDGREHKE